MVWQIVASLPYLWLTICVVVLIPLLSKLFKTKCENISYIAKKYLLSPKLLDKSYLENECSSLFVLTSTVYVAVQMLNQWLAAMFAWNGIILAV